MIQLASSKHSVPDAPPPPPALPRESAHRLRLKDRVETLRKILLPLVSPGRALIWEVGCGHGHFLTAYAAAHPEVSCLGVDIARDRILRARRKAERARLPHLHFIQADAWEFLEALPARGEFSAIFVLFPDPWPKRRHHKNRLMQPAFLQAAADRAGEGAHLYFRTDFLPYFEAAAAAIRAHPMWELIEAPWPMDVKTVFQARADQHYSLVARKRPHE